MGRWKFGWGVPMFVIRTSWANFVFGGVSYVGHFPQKWRLREREGEREREKEREDKCSISRYDIEAELFI